MQTNSVYFTDLKLYTNIHTFSEVEIKNTNRFRFIKRLTAANLKPLVFTSDRLYPLVSEIKNKQSAGVNILFSKLPFFKKRYDVTNGRKKEKENIRLAGQLILILDLLQ
jgi:hypothetical protein